MADMNILANDAPAEQAHAVVPPTRTDDQNFPSSKWVPIDKSNRVLDVQNCQLDEQWFNLHKDVLRDALDITPTNDNNPYVAPPSSDIVIEYVTTLGYPSTLRNMSTMSIHWGIIHRSNIDYAERIWEEFVQSIQTFITDRKNLAIASRRKKKTTHLLISNVRLTKLIIYHLKTMHNIHLRTGSPLHYSHDESILNTLRFVGKDGREIFDVEHGKAEEGGATKSLKATKGTIPKAAKATKPAGDKASTLTSTQPPKPKPTPTQPSKVVPEKKQKLVKETPDEPSPAKRSKGGLVGKIRKPRSPLKLVDEPRAEDVPGPAHPVVIREPDSGRIQPLPDVQGKGNEKVVDEQAAHDLFTLLTPKNKSPAGPNPGDLDEGPAGQNPGVQDEGQGRSNPTDAAESQPQSSHVVHVGPNREHMDLEATDTSTCFTDQFFMEKQQEEEPRKTNAEAEVQSMVSVPIHQDTSSVPPMTTLIIDLTTSQSSSPLPTSTETTSVIMTATTIPPPPPQPQQRITDATLVSKAVDEIVTDAVDWAMQALLRAHFSDLPAPPPPPPPAGASGAPGTSRASRSSQLPLPPPPPSTGTSGSAQQQGSEASNLEYLRYGSKGSSPELSISKIKAASYPDFGLELLVPEQMWIDDKSDQPCGFSVSSELKHTPDTSHLDHLPGYDKWMLSTAVKLWTRNVVIQQRVEDFQLDIESYQTQLNLTKPGWDATCYEFKHDYTIIESPRAVVFPVNNNERKIMRVKEFKIKRLNPGMNMRFWTQKDVTRSKEFIAAIKRRLKTRRIYRNLECFVSGRVRDIDYRLIQRTK
nr:hypothetical protein [Tanacetum cinerariifolium]